MTRTSSVAERWLHTKRWNATSHIIPLLAFLMLACGGSGPENGSGDAQHAVDAQHAADAQVATHADGHAHADPGADAPLGGMSVYQLDAEWQDRTGAARTLEELGGTPQAIAMVYTNCGSACPRIVADMKRLEAEFPGLGLVLVSIDPERDTPGQLDSFANGARLGERWTLLSGPDDQVIELAAVLGVRYRRISETDFMHSNVISILDEGGTVVHRQEALGELDGTRDALRALLPPAR